MAIDTCAFVTTRARQPDVAASASPNLSFTRFVAAHGGSDSLRATDRPPQTASRNPLSFKRLLEPA